MALHVEKGRPYSIRVEWSEQISLYLFWNGEDLSPYISYVQFDIKIANNLGNKYKKSFYEPTFTYFNIRTVT